MAKGRRTANDIASAARRSNSKMIWLLAAACVALFLVFYLRTRARTLSDRMVPAVPVKQAPASTPDYVEQTPAPAPTRPVTNGE